jgi:hypothetical protein
LDEIVITSMAADQIFQYIMLWRKTNHLALKHSICNLQACQLTHRVYRCASETTILQENPKLSWARRLTTIAVREKRVKPWKGNISNANTMGDGHCSLWKTFF